MIPSEVRAACGPALEEWLERLESLPAIEVRFLEWSAVEVELKALGVERQDRVVVLSTLREMREEPFAWLLSRLLGGIDAAMGDEQAVWVGLPALPGALGVAGRCFPIQLFLLGLEGARRYHQRHGVPVEITDATLADLGRHVAIHRRMYGSTGVDAPGWMTLHLRGLLYECGRLQYEPARWRLPGLGDESELQRAYEAVVAAGGPQPGEPVLSVHIPEAGPLSPPDVDRSFCAARELFARSFAEPARHFAVCTSWLLDNQLAGYLPENANIVRFQRRFRLAPASFSGDRDILSFVFRRPDLDPCHLPPDLPQATRLERAVVAHLQGGGHWQVRAGWLPLGLRR